ncbi:hypothetical protein BD408DRAFT_414770 [Parasitella parasitica]|nr:hypothetical protein BD408DRAFT_414770 [Parasitella parasitica]
MRPACVILIIYTVALLFHTTAADIHEKTELANQQQNDDDTSLLRDVENVIDEDFEDDAYRVLKSLQYVEDEDEDFNSEDNDDEDSDIVFEDEEQDDDEFSTDLPEFKNKETAEFFEHLPQQPIDNGDNKSSVVEDNIEVEEVDDELDGLAPKSDIGEEDDEEEDDEDQQPENYTPSPVLPPIVSGHIPWQRPEPVVKDDSNSNFYQDVTYKESEKLKQSTYTSSFRFWYIFFILLFLAIVYKSFTKRKPKNFIELPSSSSSLSWNRNDEKDYLPLHSNNKRNSYYKYEVKSS